MRNLLLLSFLVTACDFQPAPPPPPAPPAPPAPASAAGSGSATTPRRPAPPPAPPVQPTAACEQTAIKYADIMIASADPSQKPAFEIDRANIIRHTEVACTQQHWTPAALACIAQSRSDAQARACLEKFPSPTLVPGAGSGSAQPPRTGRPDPAAPRPPTRRDPH